MNHQDLEGDPTLRMEPAEMRRLGYQMVDMLVEHFESLPQKPVTRKSDRPDLEAIFSEPVPENPSDGTELLQWVDREVLTNIMHLVASRWRSNKQRRSVGIAERQSYLSAPFCEHIDGSRELHVACDQAFCLKLLNIAYGDSPDHLAVRPVQPG